MSRDLSLASPSSIRDSIYKLWRKFTAAFSTTAFQSGQFWIDSKPIYRKVIDMGALVNGGATTVAHGITGINEIVSLSGVANDSNAGAWVKGLPLPTQIDSLTIDTTNVVITTTTDLTAYEQCYVVIDYTLA